MQLSPDMPRGLRLTLVGSAILHAGIVIGLVIATTGTSHSSDRIETVITTKLVRLGKKRAKELLPRKYRPPPPPPRKKVALQTKTEPTKAQPAKPEPTRTAERTNPNNNLTSALDRMRKVSEEEPEGHESGSVDGEVSDLANAFIGNRYGNEIRSCIEKHYAIEGIPPGRVRGKTATVVIRLAADGTFTDHKIEKPSGVRAADRAVERAVKRCGKVSPPPGEIRDQVIRDGIEVVFPMDPT